LHGGDIGPAELLIELEALAPVTAVYGNVDGFELRSRLPQVAEVELDGLRIVVTHGDQFGSPTPQLLHEAFPTADVIVYGHTHRPLLELVDKTVTVMNPGSAGQARFGVPPSVGIMELEPGIPPRARLVALG
jgi:putative phosphoesterase